MKHLAFLSIFLALPVAAQVVGPMVEFDQHVYGAGYGGSSSAPHNAHGLAFYAEKVTDKGTFSYTRFDIFGGNTITSTGACQAIVSLFSGRAVISGCGTMGLSTSATNVGDAFTGTGVFGFRLNKIAADENKYLLLGGEVTKNNVGIPTGGYSVFAAFAFGQRK